MPFGSIPHDKQRPSNDNCHVSDNPEGSYERALIQATAAWYVMFPTDAVLDARISHRELRVLLAMCWHSNQQNEVWCSQETLADELNIQRPHISADIRHLIQLGHVELERKAYRGADNPNLRTNKYRVIWRVHQRNSENSEKNTGNSLENQENNQPSQGVPDHMYRSGTSIRTATVHHMYRSGTQNNTREQYHPKRTVSSSSPEEDINQTSLAQSAETAPPTVTAPPERRTRERFDTSALKRDPLYIALVACLNREPVTQREWWQWRKAINELHTAGVHAADLPTAIKGFQLLWPKTPITPLGLSNQWSLIREGKSHEQQQQLAHVARSVELQQRHATAEAEREAAYRDLERRLGLSDG